MNLWRTRRSILDLESFQVPNFFDNLIQRACDIFANQIKLILQWNEDDKENIVLSK